MTTAPEPGFEFVVVDHDGVEAYSDADVSKYGYDDDDVYDAPVEARRSRPETEAEALTRAILDSVREAGALANEDADWDEAVGDDALATRLGQEHDEHVAHNLASLSKGKVAPSSRVARGVIETTALWRANGNETGTDGEGGGSGEGGGGNDGGGRGDELRKEILHEIWLCHRARMVSGVSASASDLAVQPSAYGYTLGTADVLVSDGGDDGNGANGGGGDVRYTSLKQVKRYNAMGVRFDVDVQYSLLDVVGQGAYGVVCAALDEASGETVAIKKITNAFEHELYAKRTLREIRLLR